MKFYIKDFFSKSDQIRRKLFILLTHFLCSVIEMRLWLVFFELHEERLMKHLIFLASQKKKKKQKDCTFPLTKLQLIKIFFFSVRL